MKKLKYDTEDVGKIILIEQAIISLLFEEENQTIQFEEVNTSYIAAVCMGLYDTYNKMKKEKKLTKEEIDNILVFVTNNKEEIKIGAEQLIKNFIERDKIETNIIYN